MHRIRRVKIIAQQYTGRISNEQDQGRHLTDDRGRKRTGQTRKLTSVNERIDVWITLGPLRTTVQKRDSRLLTLMRLNLRCGDVSKGVIGTKQRIQMIGTSLSVEASVGDRKVRISYLIPEDSTLPVILLDREASVRTAEDWP